MIARLDICGKRFGRLVALHDVGRIKKNRIWMFLCDCGNHTIAPASAVSSGNTSSCGCLKKESAKRKFTKHGAKANRKPTPEYVSWSLMKDRCSNPKNASYSYYGGRGISVCERWKNFQLFLDDMGERPPATTLDRIDPNGNYEPNNCRWATRKEQARNRSFCKTVEWEGQQRLLWQLAEEHEIDLNIVHQRLHRGWDLGRAITQKKGTRYDARLP